MTLNKHTQADLTPLQNNTTFNAILTFPTITGHIVSPSAANTTIQAVIGAEENGKQFQHIKRPFKPTNIQMMFQEGILITQLHGNYLL